MHRYVPPRLLLMPDPASRIVHDTRELRADRIGKADMSDYAVAKKRRGAASGSVKKLIGNNEIKRRVLFLQ